MSQDIYISYAHIQEFLNNFFEKNKKTASMFDAVNYLYSTHQYSYFPIPLKPAEPKLMDVKSLYKELTKLTIKVTPIVKNINVNQLTHTISENAFFSKRKDASILLQFQNEESKLHHHDYFEMNLVLQGKMDIICSEDKMTLKDGDFIIISPYTSHQVHVLPNSVVICITIRKSTFDEAFFGLVKSDDIISNFFKQNLYSFNRNYLLFSVPINYQLLETIQNIFAAAYSNSSQANTICCAYISILLSYALEDISQLHSASPHSRNLVHKIASVIHTIEKNPDVITLPSLSQSFNYDKDYLGKLIKRNTGYSFNYLRNYYRIKKSCQLLQFSDKSIDEISRMTGYSSPNHFERCFRQITNTSPTRFRKETLKK